MTSRFEAFAALQVRGDPLVLYNIWGRRQRAGGGSRRRTERVVRAVPLSLNLIAFPGAPPESDWAAAGVARISHGPFPHRALMAQLEEAARAAIG